MKKIEDKILSVIEKHRMLEKGDTVVLGISGGADSMCLLHFFNKISSIWQLNIICAHINHGIRGAEADSDEEFVRAFCEENSISFEAAHYNIPETAKKTGESEETCARRLRYEYFDSLAGSAKIATAHNLNDCAETFLFNLARGTGLKGLTGIPPVRDNIIRPLIECSREEIENYLSEEGISFVTDSTNLTDDYSRNKLRHNVIPVMQEINSGFLSVFGNCISSLSDAEAYLSEKALRAYNELNDNMRFSVTEINKLDKAVRDRLLIMICEKFSARDISFRHIEKISSFLICGGALMLPGGVTVASDGKYLYKSEKLPVENKISVPYDNSVCEYYFQGGRVVAAKVDKPDFTDYNIKKTEYGDAEKIKSSVFRLRKDGDRFRFPYSEHSKSLKNLFKEKNITPQDRWGVPMLADDEHILWINGVGFSHYAAADENTKEFVKIYCVKG